MIDLLVPNELPIVVQPSVVEAFGQTQAELLSRLNYWLNRATKYREGNIWVYKTVEDWAMELNKSTKTIQRAITDLEERGVLVSKQFESKDWYHGKSYRINKDILYGILGMPIPSDKNEISDFKPVDKTGQDVLETGQDVPITTRNTPPIKSIVCMGKSKYESKKEENFWNQEEDWPLIKALGDSKVDPESDAGITFAKIAKGVKANADQLKQALDICFNAKFYIVNPFGFVKKLLCDFISSESAFFNYHNPRNNKIYCNLSLT